MTDLVRVDVIVVTHNSEQTIAACLDAIAAQALAHDLTVIDCGSTDATLDIASNRGDGRVIAKPNIGFAPAVNLALKYGRAPFVLLVNPDAYLNHRVLQSLVGILDSRSRAGLVAPRLVDADGRTHDYGAKRFPSARHALARLTGVERSLPRRWRESIPIPEGRVVAVPAITGAVILARRSILERINGLDTTLPMYLEDLDLCAQCHKMDLEVLVCGNAVATHIGRHSSSQSEMKDLLYVLEDGQAPWVYLGRYVGHCAAMRFCMAVAVGASVRVLLAGIGGIVTRPEVRTRSRIARHNAQLLLRWAFTPKSHVTLTARNAFSPSGEAEVLP